MPRYDFYQLIRLLRGWSISDLCLRQTTTTAVKSENADSMEVVPTKGSRRTCGQKRFTLTLYVPCTKHWWDRWFSKGMRCGQCSVYSNVAYLGPSLVLCWWTGWNGEGWFTSSPNSTVNPASRKWRKLEGYVRINMLYECREKFRRSGSSTQL